jgi:hypothetical protein
MPDASAELDGLGSVGKRVELVIRTRPRDPNDEMFLETAIGAHSLRFPTSGMFFSIRI